MRCRWVTRGPHYLKLGLYMRHVQIRCMVRNNISSVNLTVSYKASGFRRQQLSITQQRTVLDHFQIPTCFSRLETFATLQQQTSNATNSFHDDCPTFCSLVVRRSRSRLSSRRYPLWLLPQSWSQRFLRGLLRPLSHHPAGSRYPIQDVDLHGKSSLQHRRSYLTPTDCSRPRLLG
jgi:hypothetical protein